MKLYIIAGEASGDLHGSNLMKEIYKIDPSCDIQFWGGDKMKAAGGELKKHIKHLAFMGFYEVIKNFNTIRKNFKYCKKDILSFKPDTLILIDYPGFNLRIAEWAKAQNIRVVYYISPQLWAWKESRVEKVRRFVDKMFVILPFEKKFYKKHNIDVEYLGHPLREVIQDVKVDPSFSERYDLNPNQTIALLPGSRNQEITRILPIMLSCFSAYPDHTFAIAMAPNQSKSIYNNIIRKTDVPEDRVKLIPDQTYQLLKNSVIALVASGTATLETALLGIPQVVCYTGSTISYSIAKRLVKIPYISLVNLILDRPLITELIQSDFNQDNLIQEMNALLKGGKAAAIKEGYAELFTLLGNADTSERIAKELHQFVNGNASS